jgi:PAS domain S-box-containing protein
MDSHGGTLFHNAFVRYLFAVALVASMFVLKLCLIPWTGTGAPFVLFFAAVLVTSLFAGVGPGVCAVVLAIPLGAYTFVVDAGYSPGQASLQSLLFALDGTVVVYLAFLTRKTARSLQTANGQLRESEEKYRALFDSIDEGFCVIEVMFDDADNALDYRFLEVNRIFENQTGISNAVGRRMREIAPAHEEYWFQIYGQIALTGESRRFENPANALGRFYDVYAFRLGRPEQRHVAILFNDITKRKQTEEALHRTQALNQAVLGSLAANIAVLDEEGNIIAVNDAWKRFAYENDGAAVADSVGVNYLHVCRDAPGSNGGSAALNGIQGVLNGTRHTFELEYPCHSPHEKRWFLMSVTPLLGERGGAVVTHTDITERKRAEEALQESEERLELAMEAGGIGIFEWDIRTNAVVWTEQSKAVFARRSGASRGVYDDWAKRVRPEDRLVCEASIQDVLRKKHDHWEAEYRMMSADTAEERWIHSQSHIFYDAQGEPLRMIGVNIDITERKRIERTLQEAEERFRLTIDEAPIGMALEALDGRFVRVNRALCEILGYSSGELTGLTFQAITHPDDLDADLAVKGQLARGEIPRYQLVKRYVRKDGTIVDIQLSASILRTREGAPLYFIVQVEDVTERKRAEAALIDSERRLTLALDSAQMGMWDLDLLTDTSVRSLRHDQIFGYSAAVPTWGAAVFMTHVVPEDRKVAKRAFDQAFVSDNFNVECRIRWADESIHWISATGRVYRNPQGNPVRMMGTVLDVTEQKRAQEELQRSEREFRQLAEAMPQIVWATTADGLNIYFNQQWVDYTGLTLEESYGEGWITPFHPDDRQRAWDGWQRATKHRDIYSLECRLRRADGVYQWWLIRGVPLLNANGEISKWFGTCTDIEQIKAAEQRLQESEAKFSGIVSISADAIISIDEEQRITIFNDGAEQVFGYSKAEAIGTPLGNLMPERFRKIHRQHVEGFASGPVTARRVGDRLTTITGLRKNGEEFPAEAAISKLQVGNKTILTVALRDITERKRFEKEQQLLAEAGAVLGASLDYDQTLATVAHLVVRDFADWCMVEVIDEHGVIRRLKVVARDPSKADLCAILQDMPIDRDGPYLLRGAFETKQSFLIKHLTWEQLESFAQGPEHLQSLRSMSPISVMGVPLLRQERLLGALAFISSTGSRDYGESELRLAEALAERVAMAIENARLYRSSVSATHLRDQVIGVVAHDLRNPLSTILTQLWALRRRGAEAERRSPKPAQVIERAAMRMNRLIQDLLDIAIMESGQLTIERARLSASGLIVEAVDMQRPLASASSLELRIEADSDVPEVWGDRDRLLQVFENLIGNAIKFTKAGGSITVGATSRDHEVIFRVADSGSGIAPENLPRVFDRFWQATRANRQGAGLGLPITKGIVEAHGGRIWVESTPNRGTTFSFTIPQATPEQGRPSGPSGSALLESDRAA